ncbi:MAG: hypothetical protein JRG70_19055 [Deltaproteobacteria bacterium]|nr:hypothetical protein [Deltaproteobacteria bacterium]
MARSFLVLDIETVPDPDLVWDAAIGGFPPAPFHQVVALGVRLHREAAPDDGDVQRAPI